MLSKLAADPNLVGVSALEDGASGNTASPGERESVGVLGTGVCVARRSGVAFCPLTEIIIGLRGPV